MTPAVFYFALKQTSTFVGQSSFPPLTAEAAIIVHADSGRILWGRNIDMPMYPASTTKLLTSLILLEETSPTDQITAPADIKSVRGSSLHMQPFETISAEGAAYAILLRSANDTSHAVALKISGSDKAFAQKMNAFSKKIGMRNSHWVTPHGLNNPWHKTTARDMSLLGLHAMKNDRLVEITSTEKYTIQRSLNQKDTLIENHNKLLKENKSLKGFKTGFTNPAGLCFVGFQESPIGNLVTVILNSKDWMADQTTLTKWCKETFTFVQDINSINPLRIYAPNQLEKTAVQLISEKPIPALLSEEDKADLKIDPPIISAPITKGQQLGNANYMLPDGTNYSVPVVAANSVSAKPTIGDFLRNPIGISLILFASAAYWYRRRTYDKLNY